MKKLNSSLVLGAVLASLSGQAAAELRVVVTPSRVEQAENKVPAYVDVITKSDIEAAGALSIEDALRTHAAVQVTETSFGSNVSLRGFSSESAGSNVLVLVDGQKLNNIDLSSPDLGSVAVGTVERIEIINGSAGVIYGDQAVGGVINIITVASQQAEAGDVSGSLSASSGSYSSGRYSGDVRYQLTDSLSAKIAAEKLDTDNFRDNNNQQKDTGLAKLDFNTEKIKAYAAFSRTEENLGLAGAVSDADIAANRRFSRSEFDGNFIDATTTAASGGVSVAVNDKLSYGVDFSDRETQQKYRQSFFGFAVPLDSLSKIERNHREVKPKITGNIDSPVGVIQLVAGIDLQDSDYSIESSFINRNVDQKMTSFYAQASIPVTDVLSVSPGVRTVRVEDDVVDRDVYPDGQIIKESLEVGSIAFNANFNDELSAYLKVEENFRMAKADEQAYTSPGIIGLKPQMGLSTEIGVKYLAEKWSLNSNFYHLALEDEIIFDNTATKPVGGLSNGANVNADESERVGLVVGGAYQVIDSVKVGGQYSYVDAEFTKGTNKNKEIPGVAKNTYGFFTEHKLGKISSKVDLQYTGSRFASSDSDNSSAKVDSHHVVNLSTLYKEEMWEAGLQVRNIFNEKYNAFTVEAFGGASVRRYPAAERNVWVTAKVKF